MGVPPRAVDHEQSQPGGRPRGSLVFPHEFPGAARTRRVESPLFRLRTALPAERDTSHPS